MSDAVERDARARASAEDAGRVVERHLEAVRSGDVAAMARDYAADAALERGGERHRGRAAIAAYFAGVPARLGEGLVEFGSVRASAGSASFGWRIVGGPADGTTGIDTCTVSGDRIIEQVVALDGQDF